MGHGGTRSGSGRKGRSFVCAAPGCGSKLRRTGWPRSKYCSDSCSRLLQKGKTSGPRGGVRHTVRACLGCGRQFSPKYLTNVVCSSACHGKRCRLPDSVDRLRRRRSDAGRRRREAGWKSGQKGRWRGICERDGWVCWICCKPIDATLLPPNRLSGTADHVIPLSKGGSDADDNLRAAHCSCNCRRGAGKFQPKEAA